MAEERHDGGVFIGSVNLDRGPSCAERVAHQRRAERVRCMRVLDASDLLSWDMRPRYAWAGMPFNGPELALAGNR
jgi:hypothetical protein